MKAIGKIITTSLLGILTFQVYAIIQVLLNFN